MFLTLWIAFKYLFSRKAGRFAPLLTVTSIASIAAAMAALVVVMSVMRGFRAELYNKLMGFNSHVVVSAEKGAPFFLQSDLLKMVGEKNVRDIAPFVQGEVIAESNSTGEILSQGARVRGIDPDKLGQIADIKFYFPEDSQGLRLTSGAIVGNEIVSQLSVQPDFSDTIELIAPLAELLPNGELSPIKRKYEVVGVFKAGIFDYDSKYIFVSLKEAEKLLGEQATFGYFIRLKNPDKAAWVVSQIRPQLPAGYEVKAWQELNKKLFAALKLERVAMAAVLFLIVIIASFSIMGVILLVGSAKRRDIAILKSIGMEENMIGKIFFAHAGIIGAIGSVLGLGVGLAISFCAVIWPIRLPASYYLEWLPVEVNWASYLIFAVAGVAIAVLSAIFPVRQAMKFSPIEILRYE